MQELKKQVDEIFTMVSLLRVSGDAVDIVATVREKLRRLYKHIEKLPDVQPPSVLTTPVADLATAVENDGGWTIGTLPAVKISGLPPTPDIYDSKRVPAGLKGPKGEPGVKEVNDNG